MAPRRLFTIGHGTQSQLAFGDLLAASGITRVVDIRRYPGSRRHPQFGRDAMQDWLPARGVDYRWEEALGGRRRPRADSPNIALRNEQFRAYADYMATAPFIDALDGVLAEAGRTATAVMCAESVWWNCHRRLVADAATLLHDVAVLHVFPSGEVRSHRVTPGTRVADARTVVYDAVEEPDDG